ncbi:unnamed protein product [Spirodela intermedia]|uniref:Uncharacterized protein n=1 Tax=Spirodela intermedia TaxID=51605 RepID=A0ABN7EAR4_SPIIN|nr:unnamed protein product [Spirodela intermedia]
MNSSAKSRYKYFQSVINIACSSIWVCRPQFLDHLDGEFEPP